MNQVRTPIHNKTDDSVLLSVACGAMVGSGAGLSKSTAHRLCKRIVAD